MGLILLQMKTRRSVSKKELSARMEQEGLTGYADGVAAGKNSFYIMDGDFSSWGSSWDCCL